MSHRLYLHFETLFLVLLEVKNVVLQQDEPPKDTFIIIHLIVQNVTRWGPKKVSRII
jgi:hypothetical protein